MNMNQKEHLKGLLSYIDNPNLRLYAISEWLEDINWHTENGELYSTLSKAQQKFVDVLQYADYIARPSEYSYNFIEELYKTNFLDDEELKKARHEFATGHGSLVKYIDEYDMPNSILVSSQHLRDFQQAKFFARCMSYTWGWGLNSIGWKATRGKATRGKVFVDELLELVAVKEAVK